MRITVVVTIPPTDGDEAREAYAQARWAVERAGGPLPHVARHLERFTRRMERGGEDARKALHAAMLLTYLEARAAHDGALPTPAELMQARNDDVLPAIGAALYYALHRAYEPVRPRFHVRVAVDDDVLAATRAVALGARIASGGWSMLVASLADDERTTRMIAVHAAHAASLLVPPDEVEGHVVGAWCLPGPPPDPTRAVTWVREHALAGAQATVILEGR